jgi:hypothetical protein
VFIEIVCRAASFAFANLRLDKFPDELWVTRELQNSVATAMEDPCLTGDGFARVGVGLCLWAIQELETELAALRLEQSGSQDPGQNAFLAAAITQLASARLMPGGFAPDTSNSTLISSLPAANSRQAI